MFKNREEAGYLLADKLKKYKNTDAIILGIPRGGVPLACIVAEKLQVPLDVILSKKIGHPHHKEFAIGAVTLNSRILSKSSHDVDKEYIENETKRIKELLQKRYRDYYGDKPPLERKNKILIIIDDGIATGNTVLATIAMLHEEKPKKIVVAIPVSPISAYNKLNKSDFIDEVICLSTPMNFQAVGQFYQNFDQVDDFEVKNLLNKTKVGSD
jgi:putative phosphoribosyl transferase